MHTFNYAITIVIFSLAEFLYIDPFLRKLNRDPQCCLAPEYNMAGKQIPVDTCNRG